MNNNTNNMTNNMVDDELEINSENAKQSNKLIATLYNMVKKFDYRCRQAEENATRSASQTAIQYIKSDENSNFVRGMIREIVAETMATPLSSMDVSNKLAEKDKQDKPYNPSINKEDMINNSMR